MTEDHAAPILERLLERLQEQESLELEFKTGRGGVPKSLWSTVSAFANTQGGWILLGIDENEQSPLVGVGNPQHLAQALFDQIRDPQKISYPVCGANDVTVEHLGNKSIVVMRVPAAPRRSRPVYLHGNPYQGTYVRRNSGDYRCTRTEVDRMIRDAASEASDSAVVAHFTMQDIDADSLARYRRRFQTLTPASPWNSYDDRRFLEAITGFRRDRDVGLEGVTVAGLLMLGTEVALREWRSRHLIDFRLVLDEDSDVRWDDRVPWEGNLLGAFETIYPKLTDGQPVPFRLEAATRVDQSPVHVALREALVNLLVHADYSERQASLIKRTRNGYLFRNPGDSRVPEADLLTGDRSDPRNPTLVRMFRLIGLADEAGTGMPKILRAWRQLGFQLPGIEVGTEHYEFSLNLRHVHMLSEEERVWLQTLGSSWSEAEQLALVIARLEGEVDNLAVRRVTGLHMADVTKVLGGLRDRGYLHMVGGKRGARYYLDRGRQDNSLQWSQPTLAGISDSLETTPESLRSDDSLGNSAADSGNSGADSMNFQSSPLRKFARQPQILRELEEIAQPARERGYLPATVRNELIVRLCTHQPLSVRELAFLLARSEDLVRKAVKSLLARGLLRYLYPDQPQHPAQQYTHSQNDTL